MKRILTILILVAAVSASNAATFYLLSQQVQTNRAGAPLPLNPLKNCPAYLVVGDIWLIDDSLVTKIANKPPIDDVLGRLRKRIETAQLAAAWSAVTNPPAATIQAKPVTYTNWFNREVTNLDLGVGLLERDHPGVRTNFGRAQRGYVPTTNNGFPGSYQRLPHNINKDNPRFKELLEEWKRTNNINQEKPIKGSGGGDYGFYKTAFYGITVRPTLAPTAQNYPFDTGTNFIWPQFSPSLAAWQTYSNLLPVAQWFTNCTSLIQVDLYDGAEFAVRINYPDVVSREQNDFVCAEVNLFGECESGATFDVTNQLVMAAGAVNALWFMYPSPGCTFTPPLADLDGARVASLGPETLILMPPAAYPIIDTTQPKTIDLHLPGRGFAQFQVQSVPTANGSNWAAVTNLASGANGVVDVTLDATNSAEFFRVIGF